MTFMEPRFPPELVDLVLDELVSDKEVLASVSLVARWWRHRANPYRFHSVSFWSSSGGEDNVSRPVNALRSLLDADAATWPPHEQIAPYFTYVGCPLEMTDWRERTLYESSPCMMDGSMAAMLRSIFKPEDQSKFTPTERTLELWTTHGGFGPLSFDYMNPTFKDTIYEICSNSSVSHFSLSLFDDVSITLFLSCATVTSLNLNQISSIVPRASAPVTDSYMQAITYLSVRKSPSFLELAVNSPNALGALTEVELTN